MKYFEDDHDALVYLKKIEAKNKELSHKKYQILPSKINIFDYIIYPLIYLSAYFIAPTNSINAQYFFAFFTSYIALFGTKKMIEGFKLSQEKFQDKKIIAFYNNEINNINKTYFQEKNSVSSFDKMTSVDIVYTKFAQLSNLICELPKEEEGKYLRLLFSIKKVYLLNYKTSPNEARKEAILLLNELEFKINNREINKNNITQFKPLEKRIK